MSLLRRVLAEKALQFYLLSSVTVLLPLLVLLVMGLLHLWQQGWMLWFGLASLLLALATAALHWLLGRDASTGPERLDGATDPHLPAVQDWSEYEVQVWQSALANINEQELTQLPWADVPRAMLDQLSWVARTYHPGKTDAEYAFTVPELMLMLEVCSRKYRAQVLANVPLSRQVKVSEFMGVSRATDATYKLYKKYALVIDAARALLTGGASVPSRLASALMSEVGSGLSLHMQKNMKQLLFEQVSQVAIDLYSGRLTLAETELAAYQASLQPVAEPVTRPLTVMVVGQVNAGKSSLVNALRAQSVAEVDVLPSTAGFHHYQVALTDDLDIILVDSPGLDGSKPIARALLQQATSADLLLWLCQANQPAKALDKALMVEWDQYFQQHLGRKKPPLLLLTTHNDRLPPPGNWQPPYDLGLDSDSDNVNKSTRDISAGDKKARTIAAACNYTREALGLDDSVPVLPIALKPDAEPYNLNTLRELLLEVSDEARAAQLNRERFDAAQSVPLVATFLAQAASLARSSGKIIFR